MAFLSFGRQKAFILRQRNFRFSLENFYRQPLALLLTKSLFLIFHYKTINAIAFTVEVQFGTGFKPEVWKICVVLAIFLKKKGVRVSLE